MQKQKQLLGATLIELIITIGVTATLLTLVIPTLVDLIDKNRLKATTETLYSDLQFAKLEAIKRNKNIRISFTPGNGGSTWCYGIKENASCDCNAESGPNLCHLDNIKKVVRNSDFPGISIRTSISTPGDRFTFEGIRGIADGTFGKVILTSAEKETRVIVSRMGRIRTCSPSGAANVTGYSTSC
jgi:type IV fimbrial biogenesis protein FimT